MSFPIFATAALLSLLGCHRMKPFSALPAEGVRVFDVNIHSTILGRDLPMRVAMPETIATNTKLPVIYLLHGYAANYTSFSAWTAADSLLVPKGYILVMPEDVSGFYLNQAGGKARYEDYFLNEVIPMVSAVVPQAANDRAHRAVVGMSRGGYGAMSIALRHPEEFAFAGGLNSAFDISTRPFIWTEFHESLMTNSALGPPGSPLRSKYNPMTLIHSVNPATAPFIFLAWSKDDDDSRDDKEFAQMVEHHGVRHSFAEVNGGHTWEATSDMLPPLADALAKVLTPVHQ
ncbi:alpha/beta hydrolase [Granulicella cerasi]|nr:esterase family protein [Granulicella cerasi]